MEADRIRREENVVTTGSIYVFWFGFKFCLTFMHVGLNDYEIDAESIGPFAHALVWSHALLIDLHALHCSLRCAYSLAYELMQKRFMSMKGMR